MKKTMVATSLCILLLTVAFVFSQVSAQNYTLYDHSDPNQTQGLCGFSHSVAQTFTPSVTYELYNVRFYGSIGGGIIDSVTVSITTTVNGFPSSGILGQKQIDTAIDYNTWNLVNFDSPILVTAGVQYALVITDLSSTYVVDVRFDYSNTVDNYAAGQLFVMDNTDLTWETASTYLTVNQQYYQYCDMFFEIYGLLPSPTPTPTSNPNPTPTPTPTPYIEPTPTPSPTPYLNPTVTPNPLQSWLDSPDFPLHASIIALATAVIIAAVVLYAKFKPRKKGKKH